MPGREKRKRSRKQRARRAPVAVATPPPEKSKDDIAREELVPLDEGERPLAVTIGAIAAGLLALSNIIGLLAGIKVGGDKPQASAVLLPTALSFSSFSFSVCRLLAVRRFF